MTTQKDPFKGRRFGAHTSIAGGVLESVGRAQACGFTAAQIFVKSNKQWFAASPISDDEAKAFRAAADKSGIFFFGHTGYLINLGSGDPEIAAKSIDSLTRELERAETLGLPFLVLHPGSPGDDGEEAGLDRIASRLRDIFRATKKFKVKVALEITAGQGRQLGAKFEHLRAIIDRVAIPERLGVCLDTAHLFAAGYDLRTPAAYKKTMADFEKVIGAEWLLAFHLNDSKVPFGSRKDRHDHLGEGEIGLEGFKQIVADKRWHEIPMCLETPKEEDMAEDVANLKKLQPFIK
jgi:deoxyribonuclease-4